MKFYSYASTPIFILLLYNIIMKNSLLKYYILNPLVPELSTRHTPQKTWDLNGHSLLCIFLASDLRRGWVFLAS